MLLRVRMRTWWSLGFAATLLACSSSLYGTGASPAEETSEEPTTPAPSSTSGGEEKNTSADAATDASALDDSQVTVRENGKVIAITKGVASPSTDGKLIAVELRENPSAKAPQPMVSLVLERTGSGCTLPDGGGGWQSVSWFPQGVYQGAPNYGAARSASCGLTVTRADRLVGGRATGAFDGDVHDAVKNVTLHLSVTFDVAVRKSL